MRISMEALTKPGMKTLFLAEARIEKSAHVPTYKPWWGLWLSWWLYKPKYWREWLWGWEIVRGDGWYTFEAQLLGLNINWQRKR